MKLLLSLLVFVSSSHCAFAQNDTIIVYLDSSLQVSSDPKSVYIGKAYADNSAWRFIVTNRITNNIILRSLYSDVELQTLHGPYEVYFDNGSKKTIGQYKSGKEAGLWKTWNERGVLLDSIIYENGDAIVYQRNYYNDWGILRSYEYSNNETGEKKYRSYYDDGTLQTINEFTGKAGLNKTFYPSGKQSGETAFDAKGKQVYVKNFDTTGREIPEKEYKKLIAKEMEELYKKLNTDKPEFKGGSAAFTMFMQHNLKLPSLMTSGVHQLQIIRFSFMLDEKGRAYDVKMISPNDVELERSIKEMLRVMPNWNMKGKKSYGPVVEQLNINF